MHNVLFEIHWYFSHGCVCFCLSEPGGCKKFVSLMRQNFHWLEEDIEAQLETIKVILCC